MNPRKIAIVARAGTSALAPWHDREWEIWGLPWISYPRVDRLFECHEQSLYDQSGRATHFDGAWQARARVVYAGVPVYAVRSRLPAFPGAVEWKLDEILADIPIPYMENSIAYMMATALHEGVDELGLWGVHMRALHEYEAERPSVTYLVGLAQGRGVKVHVAPGSPLFMSRYEAGRYGASSRVRNVNPLMKETA